MFDQDLVDVNVVQLGPGHSESVFLIGNQLGLPAVDGVTLDLDEVEVVDSEPVTLGFVSQRARVVQGCPIGELDDLDRFTTNKLHLPRSREALVILDCLGL